MEWSDTLLSYLASTGFGQWQWQNGVMLLIGLLFIALAIYRGFEPLLLLPIGFGMLIGNIPYDASKLSLGVYDGPVAPSELRYYRIQLGAEVTPEERAAVVDQDSLWALLQQRRQLPLTALTPLDPHQPATKALYQQGQAILVNSASRLTAAVTSDAARYLASHGQGRFVLVAEAHGDGRYGELWREERQDPRNASIFWWLFAGVGLAGFYPPLIFLGIGAMTDFGPILANPRTLLLGAAAQFGIFASLLGALWLGFDLKQAAAIGIIGGADGPTAIFTCAQLAPELLGAVALAAYAYMALIPLIQPPIVRLLTSPQERAIIMPPPPPVSPRLKILFPVVAFVLTALIAPGGMPLLSMLFLGNLLRESGVTERLAQTAKTSLIDIVTILLGVTIGAKTAANHFLTLETLGIFALGVVAFAVATATGVLAAKLLNAISRDPLNPIIGAAGVSAVPMAARVAHRLGQEANPNNYLLMHAMGPNVAGVIGSAVAAGVLLSRLS